MKKYIILASLVFTILVFSNCHPTKSVTKTKEVVVPKLTYTTNLQAEIVANCTPCHFPAKGGNKKPLDSYAAVQANIDDAIRRIELNPTDKGFMPFKHAKLSDADIAIFTKWKADGMLEK